MLKISVVIPSYNQGQFLEETILSVINQNYPNLEVVIIDGDSTDNSKELINKYFYAHKFKYIIEINNNKNTFIFVIFLFPHVN